MLQYTLVLLRSLVLLHCWFRALLILNRFRGEWFQNGTSVSVLITGDLKRIIIITFQCNFVRWLFLSGIFNFVIGKGFLDFTRISVAKGLSFF